MTRVRFLRVNSRNFHRNPITVKDRVIVQLQQGKGAGRG